MSSSGYRNLMKIAVIGTRGFPEVQGGVESHCEQLYPHLVNIGCDVTVFTRGPYVSNKSGTYKGIKLISVDCPRNKFLEAIVHTFKCVFKAKMLHPDIVHIHAIGPSLFTPLARLLGMKVVVTIHGHDYMRKKWNRPAKVFLKFCERMGMVFANEAITISEYIADEIKRRYRKSPVVIPNGANIPKPAETEESLIKYGILKHKYILSVGRFVPEKGFEDLIDAFNKINRNEWKLVIVGDADHEDRFSLDLKAKAKKNNNIVLTGFLKGQSLHELYYHAGLFVLPSSYEGLPIVLLEAMSYGLSCIASDIPANKNVELPEKRFFRTGDIENLAAKIEYFIQKPWSKDDKSNQIRMVSDRYNWAHIAARTLAVYEKVLIGI